MTTTKLTQSLHNLKAAMEEENTAAIELHEKKCNLIVNFIPSVMSCSEIRTLFEPYGPILSAKLIRNVSGKSMCYGFVRFYHAEDAAHALTLNGIRLHDKRLRVSYAFKKKQARDIFYFNNLIVRYIPKNMSPPELYKLFSMYGTVLSARVFFPPYIYDPALHMMVPSCCTPCLARGVAFVLYDSNISAMRAIRYLNGYIPYGSRSALQIRYAIRQPVLETKAGMYKLYPILYAPRPMDILVRNVHTSVGDAQLKRLFEPYGIVLRSKIARKANGRHKGYGYVRMLYYNNGTKAIEELNGAIYMARILQLKAKEVHSIPFDENYMCHLHECILADKNYKLAYGIP